jgi:hypothetical protein
MCIDITWRTTVFALIGLVAIATVGINAKSLTQKPMRGQGA